MISAKNFLLMLAPVVFMGSASATTMMVTCQVVSGPTELNGNLVCPQFNGLNLEGVSINVNGSISGSITLNNNASITETGSGTTTSEFMIGPLSGFTIAAPLFSAMFTTGSESFNAGQSKTSSGLTGSGTATINDTTVFTPYTGAGHFNVPVSTLTGLMITGGGGNFGGSQTTTAEASATVTYTSGPVTGVPEVNTIGYLSIGLGAILIGLLRRRQASR